MIVLGLGRAVAALAANRKPGEIAAAVAFAFILGLMPGGNAVWFGLLALTFFLKLNLGIELLLIPLFSLAVTALDPYIDQIGYVVLTHEALYPVFAAWYNTALIPLTGYNDTLIAGGLVLGILAWPVMYTLSRILVTAYRKHLHERIAHHPAVKAFTKLPIVGKITNTVRRLHSVGARFR
ncbi:MAG: TIGR03546 family protein [Spirochaetia bacterium]